MTKKTKKNHDLWREKPRKTMISESLMIPTPASALVVPQFSGSFRVTWELHDVFGISRYGTGSFKEFIGILDMALGHSRNS